MIILLEDVQEELSFFIPTRMIRQMPSNLSLGFVMLQLTEYLETLEIWLKGQL